MNVYLHTLSNDSFASLFQFYMHSAFSSCISMKLTLQIQAGNVAFDLKVERCNSYKIAVLKLPQGKFRLQGSLKLLVSWP